MIPVISWVRIAIALAAAAALTAAYLGWASHQREIGRQEVQAKWDEQVQIQTTAALAESQAKARETIRRIEAQEVNQHAKDAELAAARADAERNAADAERVRQQSAAAARDWSARLADSPTAGDLAAAGQAIAVCADVRSRVDAAAGVLAAYADAARTAGAGCEADYGALRP